VILHRSATHHELPTRAVTAREVPAIIALAIAVGALAHAYLSQERELRLFWDYALTQDNLNRFAPASFGRQVLSFWELEFYHQLIAARLAAPVDL
jgi:hypothetical protein